MKETCLSRCVQCVCVCVCVLTRRLRALYRCDPIADRLCLGGWGQRDCEADQCEEEWGGEGTTHHGERQQARCSALGDGVIVAQCRDWLRGVMALIGGRGAPWAHSQPGRVLRGRHEPTQRRSQTRHEWRFPMTTQSGSRNNHIS
jgi:hypothetical protein